MLLDSGTIWYGHQNRVSQLSLKNRNLVTRKRKWLSSFFLHQSRHTYCKVFNSEHHTFKRGKNQGDVVGKPELGDPESTWWEEQVQEIERYDLEWRQ